MMTSSEIRQSFLDFFKSKGHTIVPSSSLLPDSPNLLFTNAGMNQFVPIFLAQRAPDVDKWPGAIPGSPTRAADTQKCIRAGGKHNDLEDVGLDTYHHTFFEMLGNWSFGDYFKKEAIEWAWELVTGVWKFPKNRLYATVYSPDKSKSDPSEFDQVAYDHWARLFTAAGLDPKIHIVNGGKKDNFWMMGDTGPCGPCSEIHVDLTPQGDTRGALVNKGSAECIEIWNLVFIQFNAEPDGAEEEAKMKAGGKAGQDWRQRFVPLPARHVDTGMGFERVTGIIQNTKNFTDFTHVISNYETDVFRPIFDKLEQLSGKKYGSTLPTRRLVEDGKECFRGATEKENVDIAFRVIADHIRTVSFAIADGIPPGNKERNAVVRRILRRAGLFGYGLGFREPFFYKLVGVLAQTMGQIFPEIRQKREQIEEVIQGEEEAFGKTLGIGIGKFVFVVGRLLQSAASGRYGIDLHYKDLRWSSTLLDKQTVPVDLNKNDISVTNDFGFGCSVFPGNSAFELHDTYGFPIEETERLAREIGLVVDKPAFNALMEEQRARARANQKKQVISLQSGGDVETQFVGFDRLESDCSLVLFSTVGGSPTGAGAAHFAVVDRSPLYAEMGGQVGDTGSLYRGNSEKPMRVLNTVKRGQAFYLQVELDDQVMLGSLLPKPVTLGGEPARLVVDGARRAAIQRHHTVTHLLHWALHEVASQDASQKGSYVGPDKLTFDFTSAPLTPAQVSDVEKLVNERILQNAGVSWVEVPYAQAKANRQIMQLFGEKYGELVRVVQIGGEARQLNGYSMELCGGTHTRATGEIGLFRIVAESAISAGTRRIEAVAGLEAYQKTKAEADLINHLAGKVNSPVGELEKKIESLLAHQKEIEKQLKAAQQKQAAETARSLAAKAQEMGGVRTVIENLGPADGDYLQAVADALKSQFKGVIVLGGVANNAVSLVAAVSPDFTSKAQAGKIIQTIAPIVGGKGGGRPDNARGGGKDASKLDEALRKAAELLKAVS